MSDFIPGTIVPEALAGAIGRVSVLHSHLDLKLNYTIWTLLRVNGPSGFAMTEKIRNISDRIDLLRKLLMLEQPESDHLRIAELAEQLKAVNSDRVRLIHDEFYVGNLQNLNFSVLRRDPLDKKHKMYHFNAEVLADLESRLFKLQTFLSWIQRDGDDRWLTEPLPSLDKSPTQLLKMANQQPPKKSQPQP